jgi:ubiquinone/menaquinone biosynthesis C-methylase UbiE
MATAQAGQTAAPPQQQPAQQLTPEQQQAQATRKLENREAAEKAREVIRAMGLKPGMTVADIDTGIGFMLPFLSRNVGADGRVIAEDSSIDLLAGARQLAENQKLQNINFVKGAADDPNLPEAKVDVALLMNVYHRLAAPQKMLAAISKALKPDGRLVLVEPYKNASGAGSPPENIRFDMPELIREVEANHFRVVAESERVKNVDYLLVLEKKQVSK